MDRATGHKRGLAAAPGSSPEAIENRSTRAAAVTAYCGHPRCRKEFRRTMGRGRPRTYCSDACRRDAENDSRRLAAQIQHHREMAEMLARDLAAFDTDSESAVPAAGGGVELPSAIARAEGVLIGLADGSPLAEEFARFVSAVQAEVPGRQQHYRAG